MHQLVQLAMVFAPLGLASKSVANIACNSVTRRLKDCFKQSTRTLSSSKFAEFQRNKRLLGNSTLTKISRRTCSSTPDPTLFDKYDFRRTFYERFCHSDFHVPEVPEEAVSAVSDEEERTVTREELER